MADEKQQQEEAKGLIAQLARSGRMRIAAALVVVALVGGGLGVIMFQGGQSGKKLLFSGLELEEAAEITGKLDTAGIPNTLEGGGSAIFVDASKVEDARMMLSEQGLPTRGSICWEIFAKSDALGETQFVLNIKKLRAMEGELERSIASHDMVQSAKVHLSVPDKPLFQQNSAKPKAAVVIKLTGNMMPAEKGRAIRNLVASQGPGVAGANNKELISARAKIRYEANREKNKAYAKAYYEANKERDAEKNRARARAWRESNKERANARVKKWIKANKERANTNTRKWLEANPERASALNVRKALKVSTRHHQPARRSCQPHRRKPQTEKGNP